MFKVVKYVAINDAKVQYQFFTGINKIFVLVRRLGANWATIPRSFGIL